MNPESEHLIVEPITVFFDTPPLFEKAPPCPSSFEWRGERFRVLKLLSEWRDYRRRGRMARNMSAPHLQQASQKGSWGVGRFHFVIQVEGGRVFEIYYDRAPARGGERKGAWFLFAERQPQ